MKSPPVAKSAPLSLTELERKTLEAEFGDGLAASLCTAVSALRSVVLRLVGAGATRARLLHVGLARGYTPAYVRAIVSQILPKLSDRKRKPGAGPKTPKLAYDVLAFARALVGDRARKYLLAAAHLAKIEDQRRAADAVDSQPAEAGTNDSLPDQICPPDPESLIYKS
jgi:hypothetical protein